MLPLDGKRILSFETWGSGAFRAERRHAERKVAHALGAAFSKPSPEIRFKKSLSTIA